MNNNINPHLYDIYLHLRDTLNAKMVHRRKRKTANSIEIVFLCDAINALSGRINTLKEAEACGFWIVCRRQTGKKYALYHGLPVFQLFLTPVHPKKALENKIQAAQQAEEITFESICKHQHQRKRATRLPANTMCQTVRPSYLRSLPVPLDYPSRMSLIPLSILHRSHLVRILNITIGCMADAWRIGPITPPHRDHIATTSRPHNTLTKLCD